MKFWRVTSASSGARFCRGEGFVALNDTDEITLYPSEGREKEMALDHITRHLRWDNRIATSLISTYDDYRPANHEAKRRVKASEEEVILWEMELDEHVDQDDIEWARMYDLAKKLKFRIPEKAYHNARHEVLFVDQIPRHCFLRRRKLTNGKGQKTTGRWINMRDLRFTEEEMIRWR